MLHNLSVWLSAQVNQYKVGCDYDIKVIVIERKEEAKHINKAHTSAERIIHKKHKCLSRQILLFIHLFLTEHFSQAAALLVVPRILKSRMGGRALSFQAPLQLPVWIWEMNTLLLR